MFELAYIYRFLYNILENHHHHRALYANRRKKTVLLNMPHRDVRFFFDLKQKKNPRKILNEATG